MLGYYNYTVILTYMSLISACMGIFTSLEGDGHPYLGTFFLLFCGLCDAFDGKVARMKKDRSEEECFFGIQIDSLCDLVSFGVLPACIGEALLRKSNIAYLIDVDFASRTDYVIPAICFIILTGYVLFAMIRLAYFNVSEARRQKEEGGTRKNYEGLPVTSASLIFPFIMLLQFLTPMDLTALYMAGLAVVGVLFVLKFRVKKPDSKELYKLVAIGIVEFAILIAYLIYQKMFK